MSLNKFHILILLIIIIFVSSKIIAVDHSLPKGFYSISSIDNDKNFEDLKPINALIENSKFLALGEPQHTSNGFYRAKIRMMKYLIKELGFRTIAFEDNWDSMLYVDNFLYHGYGDAKSALMNFYPVWQANSILKMLEWVRKFNIKNPGNPVRLFGFDMQHREESSKYLINALRSKEKKSLIKEILNCNKLLPYYDDNKVQKNNCEKCMSLSSKLLKSRDPYLKKFPFFNVAAISIQANYLRSCNHEDKLQERDNAMAKILPLMHEQISPNSKTIIWAANGHIWAAPHANSMGEKLKKKYEKNYKVIELIAFNYDTHQDYQLPFIKPPPTDSMEKWLANYKQQFMFVNFHQVSAEIIYKFFKENSSMNLEEAQKEDLKNYILEGRDAVFYLKYSPAMEFVK